MKTGGLDPRTRRLARTLDGFACSMEEYINGRHPRSRDEARARLWRDAHRLAAALLDEVTPEWDDIDGPPDRPLSVYESALGRR